MNAHVLLSLSIALLALALLVVGGALLQRSWRLSRTAKTVDHLIAIHDQHAPALSAGRNWRRQLLDLGARWVESPLGQQLVAAEDRQVLDQCGVNDTHGKAVFLFARIALAIVLPLLGLTIVGTDTGLRILITSFVGFALGYMLPKWIMRHIATDRRRMVADELPLLIDMLRLLQGVGLSVDQSLHVIEHDFRGTLKVLCKEIEIASRQYRAGRSREQSLRRMATIYDNDDLTTLTKFIVQVEHHGGAVQEPLKQFSERLRENRRMDLKERVGKLTVKMTMVMVVTLLPALMTITGGAAFLAVIRALTKIAGDL
jgi:tight adherence protein C